jgi:hypothetical protein
VAENVVAELPEGTWCLRLTVDPLALDEAALQWTVLSEDPRRRFAVDFQNLRERLAPPSVGRKASPVACWNGLFRLVRGDRVYVLTSSSSRDGLVTNEVGGQKWMLTKAIRSGTAEYCWCVPFDVAPGQVKEISLDSRNRLSLEDLAEGCAGV